MVQYEITTSKSRFFPQEAIVLSLRIVNQGPTALDLPNPLAAGPEPVFLIARDGASPPTVISAATLHGNVLRPGPAPGPRIQVASGQEWKGTVTLPPTAGFALAGQYRIASRFGAGDSAIESLPLSVAVAPPDFRIAAAGYGREPLRAASGQLLFLQGGRALYKTRFLESRPSSAETVVDAPSLVQTLSSDGADPFLPLRSGAYYDEPEQWMVWRQQEQVHVRSTLGDATVATVRGVARLGQPLKGAKGDIHVFAVSSDPPAVKLLVFPPRPGAIVSEGWSLPLQGKAAGITAALGPASHEVEGHVAAVAATERGALVQHVRYQGFRVPDAFNSVMIPGSRPLPGAAIAVHGNEDGSGRIGLFVIAESVPHTLSFVELVFPPARHGSIVSNLSLGAFEKPPTASAVHYFQPAGSAKHRTEAVVAVPEKGLLRLAGGRLSPVGVQGQPTDPILLVPGKDVTFIVYLRQDGMPCLEPL
jgi:hypothetical protein